MSAQIMNALSKLDANNNNHWTAEGLPRIDTVKFIAGLSDVSRDDITKAAPNFSRTNPVVEGVQAPATGSSDPTSTPAPETAPAGAVQAVATGPALLVGGTNGEVHSEGTEGVIVGIINADDYEAASLEDKLAFAQERLAEAEQEAVRAAAKRDAVSAEVDRLIREAHKEGTPDDNATAIRNYLDVQAATLAAKAEQINKMREINIDFKALMPGPTPLDAALSGRNRNQYRRG